MTSPVTTRHGSQSPLRINPATALRAQSLAALLLGLVILFAVGFAPVGVAHNAAHDVRHNLSFPCH